MSLKAFLIDEPLVEWPDINRRGVRQLFTLPTPAGSRDRPLVAPSRRAILTGIKIPATV
jgi:hypothetical protein